MHIPFPCAETTTLRGQILSESRVTSAIVGSMPIVVLGVLLLVNHACMSILWLTPSGRLVAAAAAAGWILGILGLLWTGTPKPTLETDALQRFAASMGPQMTMPMIFLVLPTMFLLLIGPAVIQVAEPQAVAAAGIPVPHRTVCD